MSQPLRSSHEAAGLVSDMRQLIDTTPAAPAVEDRQLLERTVSARIATLLMMLLVMIIFITAAVPDVGPSLAKVVQTHL